MTSKESHHNKKTLRIGIMMRSADEVGGISVYARNIVEEILKIDKKNHYVLFYKSEKHLGLYDAFDNCTEILLPAKGKAIWDQIIIPWAIKKKILILFLILNSQYLSLLVRRR